MGIQGIPRFWTHPYPVVIRPFHAIITERWGRSIEPKLRPKKSTQGLDESWDLAHGRRSRRLERGAVSAVSVCYLPPKMEGFHLGCTSNESLPDDMGMVQSYLPPKTGWFHIQKMTQFVGP